MFLGNSFRRAIKMKWSKKFSDFFWANLSSPSLLTFYIGNISSGLKFPFGILAQSLNLQSQKSAGNFWTLPHKKSAKFAIWVEL